MTAQSTNQQGTDMISFFKHKDPVRVIRNAILDDKTPAEKGTVIEYWRGQTDVAPTGLRKQVFDAARDLYGKGRVVLCQVHSDGAYSYRMVVR